MKEFLIKNILIKKSFDTKNPMLIFGDPRGGSTWLAQSLNQIPNTIMFNEPLDLDVIQKYSELNLYWRQYIPEDAEWNELNCYLKKVFQLKLGAFEIQYFNSIWDIIKGNIPLIKFVRGKGILPWMLNNFRFERKPIILIRNPYAIISSMLKHPNWQSPYKTFKLPNTKYNKFYIDNLAYFQSLSSREAFYAANICFANKWVLSNELCKSSCIIVRYEDLLQDFNQTIDNILYEWGYDKIKISNKPSTSRLEYTQIDITQQLYGWQRILSQNQIDEISKVIEKIKAPDYYEIW